MRESANGFLQRNHESSIVAMSFARQLKGIKQELRTDCIFVGPGIQVQTHGYYPAIKDGVFISDHWPVVSRISITGK